MSCTRCRRLTLDCKIESNFKRVGKRSKHAEMEKQIELLRRNIHRAQAQGFVMEEEEEQVNSPAAAAYGNPGHQPYGNMGSEEAVSSLLHLKQGGAYNLPPVVRSLEGVGLSEDAINALFNEFWRFYHPFLPFLDPQEPPEQYYQYSPLLFWVIVSIAARRYTVDPGLLTSLTSPLSRLLWLTVGDVPNSYHVVKALCLICSWPLPTSTTSTDPTHILCGVMMKTATGIGLHRPKHTQDFSRVSVELNREQVHDRVKTWAVCNIVAQSVATGYGQPASTLYDWTLAIRPGEDGPFKLSPELEARLQIERFCDKVSKEMYSNSSDPRGVAGDELRATLTRVFKREFGELQVSILSQQDLSPLVDLHLKAAGLHLRLSALYDSSAAKTYFDDLMGLWRSAVSFLELLFDLDGPSEKQIPGGVLRYCTGYMLNMVVAAGFTLIKLLGSFFSKDIEPGKGRALFQRAIQAIRQMSVINNDLGWRLAELMVQMWTGSRVEDRSLRLQMGDGTSNQLIDDSLQLKVRCRMSMSVIFDSIWRWREDYQAVGRGNLDGQSSPSHLPAHPMKPTHISSPAGMRGNHPGSAGETSIASTHLDSTMMTSPHQMHGQGIPDRVTSSNGMGPANAMMGGLYPESNYEVFDPLNWMLDGLVDFPYSYNAAPVEASGMS